MLHHHTCCHVGSGEDCDGPWSDGEASVSLELRRDIVSARTPAESGAGKTWGQDGCQPHSKHQRKPYGTGQCQCSWRAHAPNGYCQRQDSAQPGLLGNNKWACGHSLDIPGQGLYERHPGNGVVSPRIPQVCSIL